MIDRKEFQRIKEDGLRLSDDDIQLLINYVEIGIKYEKTLNKIRYSSVKEFQKWQSEQEENGKDVGVFDWFHHLSDIIETD